MVLTRLESGKKNLVRHCRPATGQQFNSKEIYALKWGSAEDTYPIKLSPSPAQTKILAFVWLLF